MQIAKCLTDLHGDEPHLSLRQRCTIRDLMRQILPLDMLHHKVK